MTHAHTLARWLQWGISGVGLLWSLWLGMDVAYVLGQAEADYTAPADVIIVLGCPSYEGNVYSTTFSACVRVRAYHAADLYRRGLAAHIIPTGGLTGPAPSEAAAMAAVMQADGVPSAAITLEDQAHDTVQNIQYSRALMHAHGWRTAILVTEPHHIGRATQIARDAGLLVYPSPALASPSWQVPQARATNLRGDLRALMFYQLRRLAGARI